MSTATHFRATQTRTTRSPRQIHSSVSPVPMRFGLTDCEIHSAAASIVIRATSGLVMSDKTLAKKSTLNQPIDRRWQITDGGCERGKSRLRPEELAVRRRA